jgi:hypothetical protein
MNVPFIPGSGRAGKYGAMGDGVTRQIACKGCGATGEAAWDRAVLSDAIRPTGLPLKVSRGFFFHESPSGTRIACATCQQVLPPG